MKIIVCQLIIALAVICASAQTSTKSAPEWKATVKVVDEVGQPVADANVEIGFYVQPPLDQSVAMDSIVGKTDTNGLFTTSHLSTGSISLGFQVTKVGYYPTTKGHEFAKFKENDPAKWNPNVTLVLKKIGQPIPMYAKSVNLGMPVFDKPTGFDLMAGDWIAPYGKGINADIVFEAHLDQRAENDADYNLTVSFPKTGDGIQEFTVSEAEKGSGLLSSHEAPTDGYQSQWVQTRNRKPGQPEKGNLDLNRNYFFRIRTVLDENGNVKSAFYGKIYGDFLKFRYYLNPTPNSRNVEFDPKQNLLGGLKSTEQVSAP